MMSVTTLLVIMFWPISYNIKHLLKAKGLVEPLDDPHDRSSHSQIGA